MAGVAAEVWVGSSALHDGLKDPVLLKLQRRSAAMAQIQSLVWKFPYAAGGALEKERKNFFFILKALFGSQINER